MGSLQSPDVAGLPAGPGLGDGLVDREPRGQRTNAPSKVGADLSALAWGELTGRAFSDNAEEAAAARDEKSRRIKARFAAVDADYARKAKSSDKVNAINQAKLRGIASRSALKRPTVEIDGEARDGFGGSQRSTMDGASYAAGILQAQASGGKSWRDNPAVIADRARADRPAGYPYTVNTDFCIRMEALGAAHRAAASKPAFPKPKGYGHV